MDLDIALLNLDTGSLMTLTAIALGWFLSLCIAEELEERKADKDEALARTQRAIRIKSLSGRLQ